MAAGLLMLLSGLGLRHARKVPVEKEILAGKHDPVVAPA